LKELLKYSEETLLLLSMNKLLHLIDDEFESQNASKCDLLIHLGFETIQYVIIDKVRDELKALVEYELNGGVGTAGLIKAIENLPECLKEFKYPFNKVKISFDSYQYTFIPDDLFQADQIHEYSKFIENTQASDIMSKEITSANIQNVFAINSILHTVLQTIFKDLKIYGQANSFIQGIKKNYLKNSESKLVVDIHQKHVQIVYFKDSNMVFYNIFDCVNVDELNYFILNCIETLKIDIQQCSIMLSGMVVKGDDSYQRLEKYFQNIQFADSSLIVKHPEKFSEVLTHRYFPLISLDQCE